MSRLKTMTNETLLSAIRDYHYMEFIFECLDKYDKQIYKRLVSEAMERNLDIRLFWNNFQNNLTDIKTNNCLDSSWFDNLLNSVCNNFYGIDNDNRKFSIKKG